LVLNNELINLEKMKKQLLFLLLCLSSYVLLAQQPVAVEPLIKTTWYQGIPYNAACPINIKGETTPPGCGAVAAGQILNYYRMFDHGFGKTSYYSVATIDGKKDSLLVQRDFDASIFDWDNLLDSYSSGYTEAQGKAVADYLFQIGNAMHMQYRHGGSAPANDGQTIWGFHHYLHVSSAAMFRYRLYYSTKEWKDMIDRDLQAGHPVYYAANWIGCDNSGENRIVPSGHIFVIDGVNAEGKYHVNFGTGTPSNNKYVDLDVLNQSKEGTLPGGRGVCYNTRQCMVTDFYPVDNDVYLDRALMVVRPLVLNETPAKQQWQTELGETLMLGCRMQNYNVKRDTIRYGLGIFENGKMIKVLNERTLRLGPGYYLDINYEFKLPATLEDGKYEMRFVSHNNHSTEWTKSLEGVPATIDLIVAGGKANITLPPNRTLPANLYLREPIREVENDFSKNVPGKSFLFAFRNPSANNFEDTIRINFTIDGEVKEFKSYASVYDGSDVDYHVTVPSAYLNLEDKDYTLEAYYYEHNAGKYLPLGLEDLTGIGDTEKEMCSDGDIFVYTINGRLVRRIKRRSCLFGENVLTELLPKGVYIVKDGDHTKKVML